MRPIRFAVYACAKSGTTWVQRMLSAHPKLHCGESRPFGRYFDPANPSAPHLSLEQYLAFVSAHLGAPGDPAVVHARLLDEVLDTIASVAWEASGKAIYGEKVTPFSGRAADAIRGLCDYDAELRLIHLVRDPRDVIVSGAAQQMNLRIKRGGVDAGAAQEGLDARRVPDDLFMFFLDLWTDAYQASSERASVFPHVLDVRYESLLADPMGEASRLLRFLGVASDDATVASCLESASFERLSGGRTPGNEDRASFFRKGVAGDWRNWLSTEQLARIEAVAGSLMTKLGYTPAEAAA